jgi:hypothetical protein
MEEETDEGELERENCFERAEKAVGRRTSL